MKIKIISKSGIIPNYETIGSAGVDLRANILETITIEPGMRKLVPTGLSIELPIGYEAQVRARSGLAIKYGIGLINGIGTIDSDYRGELNIPMINWGKEPFCINNGDRIAQLVIAKYEKADFELVKELSDTSRGSRGFGHTGIK